MTEWGRWAWLLLVACSGSAVRARTGSASCGADAFSAGAAAVTANCCASTPSPAGAVGSGHRRAQAGCDIPAVCPTELCATTFTAFFAACEPQLIGSSGAQFASFAALNADCAARLAGAGWSASPAAAAATTTCEDDAQGAIASLGLTGAALATTGSCSEDLYERGWPVAPGATMAAVCPITCRSPGCAQQISRGASGSAAPSSAGRGSCATLRGDTCSDDGCTRYVGEGMRGRSCAQYCCVSGLTCVSAAEERSDGCEVAEVWDCTQNAKSNGDTTDDLICECGPRSDASSSCPGLPQPVAPPSTPPQSSNLPLVLIDSSRRIVDREKVTATMRVISNGPSRRNSVSDPPVQYEGWTGHIGIELRGSSSMRFPKKQ
eukprot:COSAG04_NODE_3738_length_2571_cov_1.445388_4_plen_377_part_00